MMEQARALFSDVFYVDGDRVVRGSVSIDQDGSVQRHASSSAASGDLTLQSGGRHIVLPALVNAFSDPTELLSANADALGDAIVAALASGLSQITLSTAFAKSDLASMLTRVGIRVAFADRAAATAIVPSLLLASAAGRTQLASSLASSDAILSSRATLGVAEEARALAAFALATGASLSHAAQTAFRGATNANDVVILSLPSGEWTEDTALAGALCGASSVLLSYVDGRFVHRARDAELDFLSSVTSREFSLDRVEDAVAAIKRGEFVLVVDNEDRENEGDLIIGGEFMTTEKMAFMIRFTSALICVSLPSDRLEQLELPLMVTANNESFHTAFTVSVDYIPGTTTGISASDRADTCRALADVNIKATDFARPGHMFPLRYTEGGVMRRMGHTEAAGDLCMMAGVYPAGVLAEIAHDNGSMARRDYLRVFSRIHGLVMISIADMIKYREANGLTDLKFVPAAK